MSSPLPAESIKNTIAWLHLLSYCPPAKVVDFNKIADPLIKALADVAGLKPGEYLDLAIPQACLLMVAYHQASREPEKEIVDELVKTALPASKDAKSLTAFKARMDEIAALPGRAKRENRLHRNKGCNLCAAPCRYGYFTLISDPDFSELQRLFAAETEKSVSGQSPLSPVYTFTITHMLGITASDKGFCEKNHFANLAFCLLMLSMAKSRLAFPEEQVRLFQVSNQAYIQRK